MGEFNLFNHTNVSLAYNLTQPVDTLETDARQELSGRLQLLAILAISSWVQVPLLTRHLARRNDGSMCNCVRDLLTLRQIAGYISPSLS
jgi:hypothetical protein